MVTGGIDVIARVQASNPCALGAELLAEDETRGHFSVAQCRSTAELSP
jgi:hypothetical protein